ncbi:MAG TPA: cytochrome P450, partial [Ktedonobacterales bacterium]
MAQETAVDPFSLEHLIEPEHHANPYPFYQRLRASAPVHHDAQFGWVFTRHADVVAALRDPHMSAERARLGKVEIPEHVRELVAPALRAFLRQMLFLDPPDHTRLRALVNKAFTPRAVAAMRQQVQVIVDELLDEIAAGGATADLIERFAYPLPVVVIAQMMGVPRADHDQFTAWTGELGALIGGTALTPERAPQALSAVLRMMDYFRRIIADHRAHPRDDLLQALISAEDRGDVLSEDELLGNCMLLLAAGHGTTTHLIGNGLVALFQHPDQWARLVERPELAASAVTEILRYDGTVQMTSRKARVPVTIGGQRVEAGEQVVTVLAAANRDPAQFPDPDRLDLTRAENRHVAFGHGIHYCVGAPLAQVEGQVALASIARRLPRLRAAVPLDQLEWIESVTFRGLAALP